MAENEASQLLVGDGLMCKWERIVESEKWRVGRSVVDVIWLNSFTGVDHSSIGFNLEAVGFYASSPPRDSRKEDRELSRWPRRCP